MDRAADVRLAKVRSTQCTVLLSPQCCSKKGAGGGGTNREVAPHKKA